MHPFQLEAPRCCGYQCIAYCLLIVEKKNTWVRLIKHRLRNPGENCYSISRHILRIRITRMHRWTYARGLIISKISFMCKKWKAAVEKFLTRCSQDAAKQAVKDGSQIYHCWLIFIPIYFFYFYLRIPFLVSFCLFA